MKSNVFNRFFEEFLMWTNKLIEKPFGIHLINTNPRSSLRFSKAYFSFINRPLVAAEIGAEKGEHALQIIKNLNVSKIYLIDPWKSYEDYKETERTQESLNRDFKICQKRLSNYKDKVEYIKEFSDSAARRIPNNLDYIYIDGNHSYGYVKKDLEIYFNKLKEGGVLAGDDTSWVGVSNALVDFCSKNKLVLHICDYRDWIIIKGENLNQLR